MLEAIRNLGILKMIEVLDFDTDALDSANSFLEHRKKSIVRGDYAKLQFESIVADKIGIFSIDQDEKVRFQVENVSDESWEYLFLKTASQGTYLTPTWKDSEVKLKRTVAKFMDDSKKNKADWLQKVVKIFTATNIEIGELSETGESCEKSFHETIEWAKKKRNIKVFSIKINKEYNAQNEELLETALLNKPRIIYQTERSRSFISSDIRCSLCGAEAELFPNVLSGVGINIANVDKQVFFPGIAAENSSKAFPICAPCAEALYAAKFHVLNSTSELRQDISGHRSLIIPHIVRSDDKRKDLTIIKETLRLFRKDLQGLQFAEKNILKDLSQNKGISTVTFVIGDVAGQNIKNIRKIIPDVLPSRLSEIAGAIDETNEAYKSLSVDHPWKLDQVPQPIDGNLRIIQDVLGMPRYVKPLKNKRAPFKSSHVDSLDILDAIFLKNDYPLKDIIAEFSSKLSYDFLGAASASDSAQVYSIRNNISKMVCLVSFLDHVGVVKMDQGKNFVRKYLENHEGLTPLNEFLSEESRGLNTKEKEYAFLVGLLLGKLVSIQMAKQVSSNALKWLKGLQLSQQDLRDIFVKTKSKLDDYSVPKSAWSDEMKGVAQAIGALGADIEKWDIDRKEIAFYLSIGQSLTGFYLPSKSKSEASAESD
jgi:CRISPR-associated protein Cas8b/Csh1 subtype I-B